MARIRSINPQALMDEDVATMTMAARLLWAYLPCHADREGRLRDSPFTLKAAMFPADDVNVEALLVELASRSHIVRYEVGGARYIQIRNFLTYQNPHKKEMPSKIPGPTSLAAAVDERKRWVYFIRNNRTRMIKIGTSMNLRERIIDLQIGSTDPLEMIGVMQGDRRLESGLHRRFKDLRETGEWFRPGHELVEFIDENSSSPPPEAARKSPGGDGEGQVIHLVRPADPDPDLRSESRPDQTRESTEDVSLWTGSRWLREYKLAWDHAPPEGGTAFYGDTGDSKACATLDRELERLPAPIRIDAQAHAPDMFAEYFASTDQLTTRRRYPFALFVQEFGGLRSPKRAAAGGRVYPKL